MNHTLLFSTIFLFLVLAYFFQVSSFAHDVADSLKPPLSRIAQHLVHVLLFILCGQKSRGRATAQSPDVQSPSSAVS